MPAPPYLYRMRSIQVSWLATVGAYIPVVIFSLGYCEAYGARYAVIMGVADYPGTENDLDYTDDDAMAVAARLTDDEQWPAENVVLLIDSQATKENLLAALQEIAAVGSADDLFLLYFSGHGTTGPDLVPYDELDGYDEYLCAYGSTWGSFIRDDELSEWLASLPMERIIVALDTCYSGGQIRTAGGRVKSWNPGTAPTPGDGFVDDMERVLRAHTRPLDLDELEKSVVVLTSSAEDELSWEMGPPYNHGLFTYYLLEAMAGQADVEGNGDWMISAEECFSYLEARVVQVSEAYGLDQHPQLLDSFPGEAIFLDLVSQCTSIEHWLEPGWHMISVPGPICGPTDPQQVFGDDVSPLTLYQYDPELGGYQMYLTPGDLDIVPGRGYWLKVSEGANVDVELFTPDGQFLIPLTKGWNLIGIPFLTPVLCAELLVVCEDSQFVLPQAAELGWVSPAVYGYDPAAKAYFMVDITSGYLEPWRGYWLRVYREGCSLAVFPTSGVAVDRVTAEWGDSLDPSYESSPPSPPQELSAEVLVQVVPMRNPIRDFGGTIFKVEGICPCKVRGLEVRVYDLAGELVWRERSNRTWLFWSGEDLTGAWLPNGVYLYRALVELNEGWEDTGVQKIVLFR